MVVRKRGGKAEQGGLGKEQMKSQQAGTANWAKPGEAAAVLHRGRAHFHSPPKFHRRRHLIVSSGAGPSGNPICVADEMSDDS